MTRTYTATRELTLTDGSDSELTICIRYHFTVDPGCAATRTQPEEGATIDITKIMVCDDGVHWYKSPDIAPLAHRVFGDDDAVHGWLMAEAMEQSNSAADDAADHKRQLRMESAE